MKDLKLLPLIALIGMGLGMASVPKTPSISFSCTQTVTPYVNNIIQNCITDCTTTGNDTNCTKTCDDTTCFSTAEYHDQIVNKFGNVL